MVEVSVSIAAVSIAAVLIAAVLIAAVLIAALLIAIIILMYIKRKRARKGCYLMFEYLTVLYVWSICMTVCVAST